MRPRRAQRAVTVLHVPSLPILLACACAVVQNCAMPLRSNSLRSVRTRERGDNKREVLTWHGQGDALVRRPWTNDASSSSRTWRPLRPPPACPPGTRRGARLAPRGALPAPGRSRLRLRAHVAPRRSRARSPAATAATAATDATTAAVAAAAAATALTVRGSLISDVVHTCSMLLPFLRACGSWLCLLFLPICVQMLLAARARCPSRRRCRASASRRRRATWRPW